MNIAVLADSHDHMHHLERAITALSQHNIDVLVHAGDFVAPFTIPLLGKLGCPVLAVFGNNDGERVGLSRKFAEIGATLNERPWSYHHKTARILVQHEPVALSTFEGCKDFDLVVYGHTHVVDVRCPAEGALVVNPGEVCGWLTGLATCAVVSLIERKVEIINLTGP